MRSPANAEEDRAVALTPQVPWRVAHVEAKPGFRLVVRFVDGAAGEVDMSALVSSERGGVFRALGDAAVFNKVYLDHGAVTWPGEIDLAPDAMYDAIRQDGCWILT